MTEANTDSTADAGSKEVEKAKDKKSRNRPLTKIVVRRLPPTMTEKEFLEQVSPIPDYDYLHFAPPDLTLDQCAFARAYINFVNYQDIFLFRDKYDGYVFVDEKGVEYMGLVDFAPFQRIPKKRKKKDPKCATIESDPVFQEYIEAIKEPESNAPEIKLEYSYQFNDSTDKKKTSTPLLDFVASRRAERRARDERRRRGDERRGGRGRVNEIIQEEESPETDPKKKDEKKKEDKPRRRDEERRNHESERRERRNRDSPKESRTKDGKKSGGEPKRNVKSEKKSFKDDDIKPFTQLPQVKTKDLAKIIDNMEKKLKIDEKGDSKEVEAGCVDDIDSKLETSSLGEGERGEEEEDEEERGTLEKAPSTEREDSSERTDGATPRRIRNKDRPSLVIYQPGMGKFSKQRISKDKEKPNSTEEKDT